MADIDYNLHPAGLAAAGLLPGSTCICTLWFIKLQSSMKTTATETFIFPLNFPNFLELREALIREKKIFCEMIS